MAHPQNLVVDISSHGFGHLAQTGPVLNELARRVPGLRLTVRCALPREALARHIGVAFDHAPASLDFGMTMHDAVDVDAEASAARYVEFHRGWDARVETEARRLAALTPDLVLANVPYLSLAAAQRAGVPAVAMCSLNWADIFADILGGLPGARAIHAQMLNAYRSARRFLRVTPGMPMDELPNREPIGPIARLGTRRRERLEATHGIARDEKLVLAALGGIPIRFPVESWPRLPGMRWVVPADWSPSRGDTLALEALELEFADLLASSDAVITKPGYGTFTEAACNGLPVLYLERPHWPETACLVQWLQENTNCTEVDRGKLATGAFAEELLELLATPPKARPRPTGAAEAAVFIAGLLRQSA